MGPLAPEQTSLQTRTGCMYTGARMRDANLVEASCPLEGEASSLQANVHRFQYFVSEQRLPFHLLQSLQSSSVVNRKGKALIQTGNQKHTICLCSLQGNSLDGRVQLAQV